MLKLWIGLIALSSFMVFEHSQDLSQMGMENNVQVLLNGLNKPKPSHSRNNNFGHLVSYKETQNDSDCDPTNSSFEKDIFPILKANCVNCHSSMFAMGEVNLDSYNNILPYIKDSTLIRSIRHEQEVKIMPPTSKLDECSIAQIQNWIDQGSLNN